MATIKILGNKSEIGAGTRGAGLGIDAIKTASLNKKSPFFSLYPIEEIPNENQLLYHPVKYPNAIHIDGLVKIYNRMSKAVENAFHLQQFPIILSGDHSTAGATIAGLKMANPQAKIGVVWIDAHADLHTPYTTPSGNMHGTPLAISLNEDNFSHQRNELPPSVIHYWNQLKNTGNITPKILPKDIVIIGLRDYEKEEKALIKKLGIHTISVAEVREKECDRIVQKTLHTLKDCDLIYVSFDVDSLDPGISRGTGTPVPNGLRKEEADYIIGQLLAEKKTGCFEIAEVNPTLDTKNIMAETAFDILEHCVDIIKNR